MSKYVVRNDNGFFTPIQGFKGKFGEVITAIGVGYPKEMDTLLLYGANVSGKVYEVNSEGVHAYIRRNDMKYFKAIIPKGTEYWTDFLGKEIAARKMIVTDEISTEQTVGKQFFFDFLEGAEERNGIRIGDYHLTDNSFIHPTENIDGNSVRGMVCGFYDDDSPMICALDVLFGFWNERRSLGEYVTNEEAVKTFNGKEMMEKYKNDMMPNNAFELCLQYRKDKGENWFLPAVGEMMTMLNNTAYIKAAWHISEIGFNPSDYTYYMTSTEPKQSDNESFLCALWPFGTYAELRKKESRGMYHIVPFYEYKKSK